MWPAVIGALAALTGVGLTRIPAFSPSGLRRVALKRDLELFALVPPGPGRDAFQERLEIEVVEMVGRTGRFAPWTMRRTAQVTGGAMLAALGGVIAVTFSISDADHVERALLQLAASFAVTIALLGAGTAGWRAFAARWRARGRGSQA